MSRYILDTNILVYILLSKFDDLSVEVKDILYDYSNQLYVSSLAVIELVQLHELNKIQTKNYNTSQELVEAIENDYFIKIKPFSKEHTLTLSNLDRVERHNDPFDHAIIAHAITEKLVLISSDRKFHEYVNKGLDFVYNKK